MKQLLTSSRLFVLAKSGKRFPQRWYYPLGALLYAGVVPVTASLCVLPFYLLVAIADFNNGGNINFNLTAWAQGTTGISIELVFGFLPIFGLVWFWLWVFERRHLWTTGMERPSWLWKYVRGLLIGASLIAAILALQANTLSIHDDPRATSSTVIGGVLVISLGWIIQGAAEEILARGFVLPIIGTRWGTTAGIAISSILFSALHLLNPNLSIIAILNLILFGIFAALYSLFEGGLWGVFALHSAWNWTQGNLFGLPVSGMQIGVSLLQLDEAGRDWWTGGSFGPEGGLAATLVLVIASVFISWLFYRRTRQESIKTN